MNAANTNIRHDLRTPVNHIIGYAEMVQEDLEDAGIDGGSGQQLSALVQKAHELLEQVNRIRTPEEGGPPLEDQFAEWTDVLSELTRLHSDVRAAVPEAGAGSLHGDLDKIGDAINHLADMVRAGNRTRLADPDPDPGPEVSGPGDATGASSDALPGEAPEDAPRILVVDDNPSNLEILARRLEREGYRVSAVTSGFHALARLGDENFDLILLDVVMPDMDGQEVLDRVRRKYGPTELPVIMVTGLYNSDSIVQALNAGANDYITKPVDFPVALARIRTHLQLGELARDLAAANERLFRYSYMDGLTAIPNRRHFDEHYAREWDRARRESLPIAVVLMDIDYFKPFNDYYGHEAGDRVLKEVGRALDATPRRSSDLVARYGGEEFVAVLPGAEQSDARDFAERLRASVEALGLEHSQSGAAAHVTLSVGVAGERPVTGGDEADDRRRQLLLRADEALYEAKEGGRNQVRCAPDPA
ncbi:diguanylate cyclase [Thioalkalivibrio sp. ALgr3]|uniref:diguanylate cyclase n=1 Tax=Thioalkalivibrio sp. ALgr3 TaxID=1239292 RepID=UPI0003624D84|nr:diguanylate cyclase [Thioalkalivibrio sp. ALgr3]